MEIFSVILTPIVLCFSLPKCSYDILHFIRDHTTYLDGVGAVCDYSLMELDKYGNEEYGTMVDRGKVSDEERPHDGKMEQSYLSFQKQFPTWPGNPAGRNLIDKIHQYKHQIEEERNVLISSALYQSMSLHSHHQGSAPLAFQQSIPSIDLSQQAPNSPLPCDPLGSKKSQSMTGASFLLSTTGSGHALDNMPSVLRSVLQNQNIDYENDNYWLSKVLIFTILFSLTTSSFNVIACQILFLPFLLRSFNPLLSLQFLMAEEGRMRFHHGNRIEGKIINEILNPRCIPTKQKCVAKQTVLSILILIIIPLTTILSIIQGDLKILMRVLSMSDCVIVAFAQSSS